VSSEAEENKAIARRFLEETMAKGNLDVIDELAAPDFVDRTLLPGQGPTREDYKRSVAEALDTTPITSFIIEEQIAEGEAVVTKYRHSSVQRREVMGIPPTEEEKTVSGIYIHRISGGKITEEWGIIDAVLAMESLAQEIRERERIEQDPREVGGDFYDFHFLSEGKLGLVTGDATGKGVPAALVMATTCGMLQLAAQSLEVSSPGEVLSRVNETLLARIPLNTFVTCFYAILDPESGTLRYANAGHDLPYLWHGGCCEELRARGMPMGLMPGMSYEEGEVSLREGDSVLFYSDGLVEAHDPKGEMFGFPRLRTHVAEHGEERSLGDLLLEELYSFVGEGWEQEDDITLLTLKRSASRS
jgi:predicted ester cyclase